MLTANVAGALAPCEPWVGFLVDWPLLAPPLVVKKRAGSSETGTCNGRHVITSFVATSISRMTTITIGIDLRSMCNPARSAAPFQKCPGCRRGVGEDGRSYPVGSSALAAPDRDAPAHGWQVRCRAASAYFERAVDLQGLDRVVQQLGVKRHRLVGPRTWISTAKHPLINAHEQPEFDAAGSFGFIKPLGAAGRGRLTQRWQAAGRQCSVAATSTKIHGLGEVMLVEAGERFTQQASGAGGRRRCRWRGAVMTPRRVAEPGGSTCQLAMKQPHAWRRPRRRRIRAKSRPCLTRIRRPGRRRLGG